MYNQVNGWLPEIIVLPLGMYAQLIKDHPEVAQTNHLRGVKVFTNRYCTVPLMCRGDALIDAITQVKYT